MPAPETPGADGRAAGRAPGAVERGRQAASAESPDKSLKAFYRDRNLWVSDADGAGEVAITTDGSEKDRIKYGTASWVYGEELDQTTAMWWSPDSSKLAYYRFDEKPVPDYYLQLDQTKLYSKVDIEAYPKAGAAEPGRRPVRLRRRREEDARGSTCATASRSRTTSSGTTSTASRWSPDGSELLFNRTNRRQNVLELVGGRPDDRQRAASSSARSGRRAGSRTTPAMGFLEGRQAVHLGVGANRLEQLLPLRPVGQADHAAHRALRFEAVGLVKVDEEADALFYMARDGDNHMKLQLHRVGLDGKATGG